MNPIHTFTLVQRFRHDDYCAEDGEWALCAMFVCRYLGVDAPPSRIEISVVKLDDYDDDSVEWGIPVKRIHFGTHVELDTAEGSEYRGLYQWAVDQLDAIGIEREDGWFRFDLKAVP